MTTIPQRIFALRELMKHNHIDAFIVYSADPHMSEYLPEQWQDRSWISGFTGSAGWVVITLEKAGLWTDSRYFVQAEIELQNSGIELFKDGLDTTPNYIDWIVEQLPIGGVVAVNALTTSHQNWVMLQNQLSGNGIKLIDAPLLTELWFSRPSSQNVNSIFVHPDKWAGTSVNQKLTRIREQMQQKNTSYHIVSALDEIAWALNLRGSDVDYNPVFLSYLLISTNQCHLFVDIEKISPEAQHHLTENNVTVQPYKNFFPYIRSLNKERIWINSQSNQAIFEAVKSNILFENPSPIVLMKAMKNPTELEGFRKVMVRDGVALVRFFYWLKHTVGKQRLTEFEVGEKLRWFRSQGEHFVGESFGSIIGYQGNGAIVHYSAKKETAKEILPYGSILIDSGGQYLEGTTDITRTLSLGEVTPEFITDATLVLKGMIQLSKVQFPAGTRGVQLDAFARLPLWLHHKDYGHGTGHGVGSFMNVHEGPQNIRKDLNPQRLEAGMVCSNEPGFYKEGYYGIRHENLVAVTPVSNGFFAFETLTLCPFFTDIIDISLLTSEEIAWINNYHQTCKEKLLPHLEGEVKTWFLSLVQPI